MEVRPRSAYMFGFHTFCVSFTDICETQALF